MSHSSCEIASAVASKRVRSVGDLLVRGRVDRDVGRVGLEREPDVVPLEKRLAA